MRERTSILPVVLKTAACVAAASFGLPVSASSPVSAIAQGVLGNWATDLLSKLRPIRGRRRTFQEPNHDLQNALARAIARACEDLSLEERIRFATSSLTSLDPPFHAQVEDFFRDLSDDPSSALGISTNNQELVAFLESPNSETFGPVASALGSKNLPGLDEELRSDLINVVYHQVAARFWDEVKHDDAAWRAYSATVFSDFRDRLASQEQDNPENLSRIQSREEDLRSLNGIPDDIIHAIDVTQNDLKEKLDSISEDIARIAIGVTSVKSDTSALRRLVPWFLIALLGLGVALICIRMGLTRSEAGIQTMIEQQTKQDSQLQSLHELLNKGVQQRSEVLLAGSHAAARDLTQDQIEQELARRLGVSKASLQDLIHRGTRSGDALDRSRAQLLAGRPEAAIEAAEEVKAGASAELGRVISADRVIAQALFDQGKYEEALKVQRRAIAHIDQDTAPIEWASATHLESRILFHLGPQNWQESYDLAKQSVEILERLLGSDSTLLTGAVSQLAFVSRFVGPPGEALSMHERAVELLTKEHGRPHPFVGVALINFAGYFEGKGNMDDAARYYREGLSEFYKHRAITNTPAPSGSNPTDEDRAHILFWRFRQIKLGWEPEKVRAEISELKESAGLSSDG